MTIEQLLSNNGQVISDITKKMNYKSKLEQSKTDIGNIFNSLKRDIIFKLENLSKKRCCIPTGPIPLECLEDPEIIKSAIKFIKKQVYKNIDNFDKVMETVFGEDNKEDDNEKAQPEGKIEIPIAMQLTQSPINFGY